MDARFFLPGSPTWRLGLRLAAFFLALALASCQPAANPTAPPTVEQAQLAPTLATTPELPTTTPTQAPTPSPTSAPIPGVDTSIKVEGLELVLIEAGFHDSYTLIIQTLSPNSPEEQLLVVKLKALSGSAAASDIWLEQGQVFVVDADGRTYMNAAGAAGTIMGEANLIIWAFSVAKEAQDLVLKLPAGNEIPLELILSGVAQAAPGALGTQPTVVSLPTATAVMPILTNGTSSYRVSLIEMTTQGKAQTTTGPQDVSAEPGTAFLRLRLEFVSGESLFDLIMTDGDQLRQVFVSDEQGRNYPIVSISTPIDAVDWIEMLFEQMPLETGAVALHFLDFPEITLEVTQPGVEVAAPTESDAQSLPDWPAVLTETFASNTNDWPEGEFDNEFHTTDWMFSAGKYRWEVVAKQLFDWYVTPDQPSRADFSIEVEAQQVSGPTDASYGLVLRSSEDGSYYFLLNDSQYYLFAKVYKGDWVDLIDWTASTLVQPGEVNQLAVEASGSHFRLFINGQLVDELDDSTIAQGGSGVCIAMAKAGDQAIFEFDNFIIRAP